MAANRVNTKKQNIRWVLNSLDISPLSFFRFTFPMNRSRAFDSYIKVLKSALKQNQEEAIKEKLLKMKEEYNVCSYCKFFSNILIQ